ncbi:MAG: nitrite/sulfite reductase [Zoogloeaceae bacterium]|jgi:sulfite reductase (NADPH) hemoprotein beta-component|nr:nitrite/sulfite reductase [Zoogloeaceae bacterium]
MYRYDDYDFALVRERATQFRDQVARWQAGELTEDEFRPLRLQNGLYVQRQAPMLRVAVPYGMISSAQLRALAHVARTWDKGYGHFTTRHNLQFNWPRIEDCPDILDYLAQVEMHAIQTSGNCIRNITTDPFAGVAPDEVINPLPLAEILRQWSSFHPEFAFLPRKFKIAISGAREDRVLGWFNDVGLRLSAPENGEPGFTVIIGGGLGRTPVRGQVLREHLPWRHILTYLEAILRVYNLHGRRDNLYKARIKILVQSLGLEHFAQQVEAEWQHLKDGPATLTQAEYDRVSARFGAPAYKTLPDDDADFVLRKAENPAFARWAARCVHPHKQPGYAAVTLSLKAPGQAPGDIRAEQMEAAAALAEQFSFGEARSSQEQNLILADVEQGRLFEFWQIARSAHLATPTVGLLTDVTCCPGGEFCDLANAKSVPVAHAIQARFQDLDYLFDLGDLKLNISGCINACSHHHVGHIGILGVDKNNAEYYQITIGGRVGNRARVGEIIGPSFPAAEVPDVVSEIIGVFVEQRRPDETFLDTVDRIGVAPFKNRVYTQRAHGTAKRPQQESVA